jgi:hypothetical protein
MKTNIKLLTTLTFCLHLLNVEAQVNLNKTAQSTMNFLLVSTVSKASAMGEAFTIVGNGAESIFYNPAGLTDSEYEFDIIFNYSNWIADIDYLSGAAMWNLDQYGVIGAHILTVDYGTIQGTSLLAPGEESLFPLGYKDNGPLTNVGAYVFGVSYAKAISQEFSIGGNVKFAGQNLGVSKWDNTSKNNNAAKLVFDAGVKYKTEFKDFAFGMTIRNFAANVKREEVDEQLPLVFTLGAAINLTKVIDENLINDHNLICAVDFLHPNNYSERFNIGAEYTYMNFASLRFGYQTNRDIASWSVGAGLRTSISDYNVEVDYSYSAFDFFDNVNILSLRFSF